jgi:hypothetical protein
MRSRSLYGGAALALIALAWWLALDGPGAPAAPVDREASGARQEHILPAEQPLEAGAQAERAPQAPAEVPPPAAVVPERTAPEPHAAAPVPPDTRGFVDALAQLWDGESHDTSAADDERWLRGLFARAASPPGMVRSIVCRRSVCKLELHWTAQHDAPYRKVMDELGAVNAKFLATRAGEPEPGGAVPVSAYVARAARQAAAQR